MLLAQITDLHIKRPGRLAYRKVDTSAYLRACIGKLNALRPCPDAVIITGDLADFGGVEEYRSLRGMLSALTMPYYLVVGNHDDRKALRAAFPDHAYLRGDSEYVQYTVDLGPLNLIALDTQDPPHSGGRLDGGRLDWLTSQLARYGGRSILIAMHHPPFVCGIGHMDAQGLDAHDAQALEHIVGAHSNIERLICGHVHRPIFTRFGGTIASICPSPSHQVAYDLAPGGPSAFVLEPPAFHVHARIGTRWITHTVYVDDYGGHYPFYDAAGKLID